ncbi:MAG: hypothetical protein QM817_18365 [Archangium sp.]
MNSRTRIRARGQAAVELAVTCIALVPLIFFALFLEDFAYYKMEGQEPIVAANSDFVVPDYMKSGPGELARFNRLKFCDHTAGYDSYDVEFECNAPPSGSGGPGTGPGGPTAVGNAGDQMGHHHATGAHQCWLGGGQQLDCGVSKGVDIMAIPTSRPFLMFYATNWNNGGIATCSAQLKVFNFIIPRQMGQKGAWWNKLAQGPGGAGGGDDNLALQGKGQFGKGGGADITGASEWQSQTFSNIHTDGESNTTAQNGWLLDKDEMKTVVDPWALTHISAINPHEGSPITTFLPPGTIPGMDFYHPLLDRTGNYYNYYADDAAKKAMDWEKDMKDKDFLDEFAGWDVAGDNMKSVPVTWMPEKPRERNDGYASGYKDSRQQNANRDTKFPASWGPN